MKLSRRIVLTLTVMCLMAQVAAAQVLEQVPGGAWVVVKVKNLGDTSGKLASFFKELGVDQMVPELADPLASLKKELNIEKGIDEKGELAFVFIDPSLNGGDESKSVIVLVPVTDYKEFTANFANAKTEGELTEVQLPKEPDPAFISSWGKFAAISPSKELLAKKPTGGAVKLSGLTAKELEGKDAIVFVNLMEIRKTAVPALQGAKNEAINEITRDLPANMAKYGGVVKALVTQVFGAMERYLQDANSATWGLSFTPTGISGTLMTEFEPGTYLGDNVKNIKNVNDSMLTGLPQGKYLMFGGMVTSPDVTTRVMDDFLAPVNKEIDALGADGKVLKDYLAAVRKAVAASNASNFGMLAPAGNLGAESIIQTVGTTTGDAQAMQDAQKAALQGQQEVMKLFGADAGMQTNVAFTPNVKTINGVSLDQLTTSFQGEGAQMMAMMYGPNGLNTLSGKIDDKTLVVANGVGDEALADLITAAKAKDDSLSKAENVALTAKELPAQKFFVAYIAVDNWITTGLKYMQAMMGQAPPLNLPPNQPPVGFSMSTEGSAIRMDGFIPTELVKRITAAAIQVQMQMQGGGMGGGM